MVTVSGKCVLPVCQQKFLITPTVKRRFGGVDGGEFLDQKCKRCHGACVGICV